MRAHQFHAQRGLHAVLSRGQPPRDAARRRQQGNPYAFAEIAFVGVPQRYLVFFGVWPGSNGLRRARVLPIWLARSPEMITVFGSINVDLLMRVPAFPRPGETIRGEDVVVAPGGKGANQAPAACRMNSA